METAKSTLVTPKKEKMRMSKSIKKDNVDKSVDVQEVENGFIITIDKSWKDKKDQYQYETKKYISTTNPFEESKGNKGEEKENPIVKSLENFLDNGNIEIDI